MAEKKQNVVFWKDQGPDDIIYVSPDDDLRTITSVTVPEQIGRASCRERV